MVRFQVIVLVLCILTSGACAALLLRQYARVGTRLLLWSGLCFCALTVNNLLVLGDVVLLPDVNLLPARQVSSLVAVAVLLCGFIWEAT